MCVTVKMKYEGDQASYPILKELAFCEKLILFMSKSDLLNTAYKTTI